MMSVKPGSDDIQSIRTILSDILNKFENNINARRGVWEEIHTRLSLHDDNKSSLVDKIGAILREKEEELTDDEQMQLNIYNNTICKWKGDTGCTRKGTAGSHSLHWCFNGMLDLIGNKMASLV
jgi:hypothetical protein